MFSKKLAILVILVMIAPMVLAACGATPEPQVIVETVVVEQTREVMVEGTPQTIIETVQVEVTVPPEPTAVPPEPTEVPPVERNGGWLDNLIIVEEPSSDAGVSRLQAGELDVFAYTISDSELFATVQDDPNLIFTQSYGSYNELTLNPCGPVLTSTNALNPFAIPEVREAMNWAVDRSYIAQEIMGGLAVTKWFPFTSGFPDYARYVATARELEAQYAYDPERARTAITEQMEANGAELVDGKWQYEGAPVTLIFLIRTEDERREIGDYVANQLEDLGFTVDRQYKTSAEASPLWMQGNPCDGLWHVYTGGWITTAISRDQGGNFLYFYTPSGLSFSPLWQAYTPTPEFYDVATKLNNNDFSTMEERGQLFREAMELGLKDSVRVWLVDRKSFTPRRADVSVTADLAGAIAGSRLYPLTMRFAGQVGGSMTMAMPSILTEPWNPWGGSNWIYDTAVQRATSDRALMPDPYTGLFWPERIESADYIVQEGLPVAKTLDWVNLEFVPEIPVPDDALVDWDATNQVFLTAAEVYTEPQTALSKAVVRFAPDLADVKWHDGSPFDVADWLMATIFVFDTANPESAIYDESQVPGLETFMSHFKGFKITSEDPLTIEWYDDQYQLDAEWGIANAGNDQLWPSYAQGEAPWHTMAVAWRSEAAQELAFTPDKADSLEVEYMSMIGGPSLELLKAQLDSAQAENFIPYEPTLGQYITADEATARYANLQEWYRRWKHFWVGTGPYRLEGVFPVEGSVNLANNPDFVDPATKWERFAEPMLAEVEIDGPGQVTIGQEAMFDVFVTFQGEPYAADQIGEVKWLLYDATGALAASDVAESVTDGQYAVTLTADQTGALEAGSNKLEVAVVSKLVSIPTFATYEFVTAP